MSAPVRFYPYWLTLSADLLVPTTEGDPNTVQSATYLPGSTIRGALAAALSQDDPDFERLILSGAVRYLNAYPCVASGTTHAIPWPASWSKEKDCPQAVHDLASGESPGDQLAGAVAPYVACDTRIRTIVPEVATRFHHQRDRVLGRPTEERGAIFLYEAMPRGSTFAGLVAVRSEDPGALWAPILSALTGEASIPEGHLVPSRIRLGRSKKTEYGGNPQICLGPARRRELEDWSQVAGAGMGRGRRFRLLLTSPAIVRDQRTGQVDPAALEATVARVLQSRASVEATYLQPALEAGFNAKWRLPLPQSQSVAAGAVVVLRCLEDIDLGALEEIEARGIGERRIEGYGACVFLTEPLAQVSWEESTSKPVAVRPTVALPDLLVGAQARMLAAASDRCVQRYAAFLVGGAPSKIPSRSLIGRLRTPLRSPTGVTTLRTWLGRGGQPATLRRTALEALGHCVLAEDRRLDDVLGAILEADPTQSAALCAQARLKPLGEALFGGQGLERWRFSGELPAGVQARLAQGARGPLIDAILAILARHGRD